MSVDDFALRQFVYNLDVTLNAALERLEKALTPKPRGPTPCTAPCRWFIPASKGRNMFCTAQQDEGAGVGGPLWAEMLHVGCPLFEPRMPDAQDAPLPPRPEVEGP